MFEPSKTTPEGLPAALRQHGFGVLSAAELARLVGVAPRELASLASFWGDLPEDAHLRDGGRYRRRRHGSFVIETSGAVRAVPHRAHYQPVEYNALHGGIERWFAQLDPEMVASAAWDKLLLGLARVATELRGPGPWFAEVHPFRIETEGGIGRPTPEGAHRDGVDLVCVVLVNRSGIKGGETRVFQADGPSGTRFTLTEPWSALILDDARVIHETTPIQALQGAPSSPSSALPAVPPALGFRDTLVITLRARNFQGK
jgi:hypothetical protein